MRTPYSLNQVGDQHCFVLRASTVFPRTLGTERGPEKAILI